MGNTCVKQSDNILEKNRFFQSISTAMPVFPPNNPQEQVEVSKEEKKESVPNPPATLKSPHHQYKKASSGDGLQADCVLRKKTCHVKELFTFRRKLGEGRYGTTYLCVEKETGKEYACKSIAKRKLNKKENVEDVRNEIQIMEHLAAAGHQHPNIISIKGAYEDEVGVHLVMELCSGGELYDRLSQKGYYSEAEAAKLVRIIIGAVEACHSLGVMHRDLKPENLMFVDEKEDSPLKLVDFGLSTFFKPGESVNDSVGSPYYVAPEVVRKKWYGPKADIWSAGVIMYLLLSGVPPFYAKTHQGIIKQVLHGEVDFSAYPWPSISRSAKDLLKKMLVLDPNRRLTARQVLSHPWVVQVDDVAVHPDRYS